MQASASFEIGRYQIGHYPRDPKRLIVVFASAGMDGLGEPIEEFKGSLGRFDISLAFSIDRSPSWYNHSETSEAFRNLPTLAQSYTYVATLGESMGGSGALIFSGYCQRVQRILALSPQYSVSLPFISFDKRFAPIGDAIPNQRWWTFAPDHARDKAQILFGDAEWLDAVHAGMFLCEGFSVSFVGGSGHLVGRYLKQGLGQHCLLGILSKLVDFSIPFGKNEIIELLGPLYAAQGMSKHNNFATFKDWQNKFLEATRDTKPLPLPPEVVDLGLGCPTDQSSVSEWSRAKTTCADQRVQYQVD